MAIITVDVKEIMADDSAAQDATDLSVFITTAENIINRNFDTVNEDQSFLDDITKYLAAHFAALKYNEYDETKTGKSEYIKNIPLGKQLQMTVYGMTALTIDDTGILEGISSSRRIARTYSARINSDNSWNNCY